MTKLSTTLRETLWLENARACHYCRVELDLVAATFEHIVPRAFGGPTARWNLTVACSPCNARYRDSVHKCDCDRCERAVNRFHVAHKGRRHLAKPPSAGNAKPRTVEELRGAFSGRRAHLQRQLNHLDDHDSQEAAAMRGRLRGYAEILDLLGAVDQDLWRLAMAEALGSDGLDRARAIYTNGKAR